MERPEDWRQERARVLAQARVVVVKVGSAVLTDAMGLSAAVLDSLAGQLAGLRRPPGSQAGQQANQSGERRLVLVSSGAVAAGRAALAVHGRQVETTGLAARQAAAAVGQGQLMRAWDAAFHAHGMPTAQVLLTRDDLRARQRFLNARNTFAELLQWRVLPIVNENDTVSVSELKFGDNDCLASLLVNLTGADLFINLTSSPGVLAANPQRQPDAPVMDHIDDVAALDLSQLCGGKTSVGTGGMYSKLLAARRAAQWSDRTEAAKYDTRNSGLRPDRAVIVYANKVREAFGDIPLVIGGLEASLRLRLKVTDKFQLLPFASMRRENYDGPATVLEQEYRRDTVCRTGLFALYNLTSNLQAESGVQYVDTRSSSPLYTYRQYTFNMGRAGPF